MDRRVQVREAAGEIERGLFAAQCRRLENEYRKRKRRETVAVFENLFQMGREQGKEAAWLGISWLNTSLETKSYEVLLSLYSRELYFDPYPVERYFVPPVFGECMEEDMATVVHELHRKFPRLCQFEEAIARRTCGEYYQAALFQLCADLGSEIMGTEAFGRMKKAQKFTAFFGLYHGEGEVLWHTGEK